MGESSNNLQLHIIRLPPYPQVADPGFSWGGGGLNSQSNCANLYFCQNLHENERIWTPREGRVRVPGAPLDPPMLDPTKFTTLPFPHIWSTRSSIKIQIIMRNHVIAVVSKACNRRRSTDHLINCGGRKMVTLLISSSFAC